MENKHVWENNQNLTQKFNNELFSGQNFEYVKIS